MNLADVFNDTRERLNSEFRSQTIKLQENTRFYKYPEFINLTGKDKSKKHTVSVVNEDTVTAILKYNNTVNKVAVLNFAEAFGIDYVKNDDAVNQEACLCRCSNLYESLLDNGSPFYKLNSILMKHKETACKVHSNAVIYSPDVFFFKVILDKLVMGMFKILLIFS